MKTLIPPVVLRDTEPWDGTGLIDELGGLLFESHAVDDVLGTFLGRKIGIEEGRFLSILRAS